MSAVQRGGAPERNVHTSSHPRLLLLPPDLPNPALTWSVHPTLHSAPPAPAPPNAAKPPTLYPPAPLPALASSTVPPAPPASAHPHPAFAACLYPLPCIRSRLLLPHLIALFNHCTIQSQHPVSATHHPPVNHHQPPPAGLRPPTPYHLRQPPARARRLTPPGKPPPPGTHPLPYRSGSITPPRFPAPCTQHPFLPTRTLAPTPPPRTGCLLFPLTPPRVDQTQRAHHPAALPPARSPSYPAGKPRNRRTPLTLQLSDFPTNRQVGKPESRKVGTHHHPPAASSTPPPFTPHPTAAPPLSPRSP